MPRTRTKYIWPPPNLTKDPTPPREEATRANIEPHTKKRRIESPSIAHLTTNERSSLVRDGSSKNKEGGQDAEVLRNLSPAAQAVLNKPMKVQIQEYREWRRKPTLYSRCAINPVTY